MARRRRLPRPAPQCIVQDGAGYGDITPIMNQLATQNPQLIFPWASGYNTVAPQHGPAAEDRGDGQRPRH